MHVRPIPAEQIIAAQIRNVYHIDHKPDGSHSETRRNWASCKPVTAIKRQGLKTHMVNTGSQRLFLCYNCL